MTITAGFCTRDGILICADSLYTGVSKVNQQKIWGYHVDGDGDGDMSKSCSVVFGIAGHEDNSKMAIEDCLHAIAACPPRERTGKKIRDLLRDEIGKIHAKYVDSHPESERDNLRFDLIIAAWLPLAGGCRMFKSSGPAVTSAEPYHCIGTGYYLGDFMMKRFAHGHMSLRQAVVIAVQGIAAAKSYDANCGGPTQFMTISGSGQLSNFVPYNTYDAESYISQFESECRSMLFHLAETQSSDETFEEELERFVDKVKKIRRYWMTGIDPQYQRLMDVISSAGFSQAVRRDLRSTTADPSPQPPSLESRGGSGEA